MPFPNWLIRKRLIDTSGSGSHGALLQKPSQKALGPGDTGGVPNMDLEEDQGKGKGKQQPKRKGKRSKGADEGEGGEDPKEKVVKHNKKVSNKITTLSSKLIEIRCTMTQLNQSTMSLIVFISTFSYINYIILKHGYGPMQFL